MRIGLILLVFSVAAMAEFELWKNKDGKEAELELLDVIETNGVRSAQFETRAGKIVTLRESELGDDEKARLKDWKPYAIRFEDLNDGRDDPFGSNDLFSFRFVATGKHLVAVKPGSVRVQSLKLAGGKDVASQAGCLLNGVVGGGAEGVRERGLSIELRSGLAPEEFQRAAIGGSATLITSSRQVTRSAKIAVPALKADRASESEKVEIGPFEVWLTRSDPFGEGKVLTTVNVTDPQVEAPPTGGSSPFDAADDTGFPTAKELAGVSVVYPVQIISVEVTDADGKQVSTTAPEVAAAAQADGAEVVVSVRYWTALRERVVAFKKEADDS